MFFFYNKYGINYTCISVEVCNCNLQTAKSLVTLFQKGGAAKLAIHLIFWHLFLMFTNIFT